MTTAQATAALSDADLLIIATLKELIERLEAGVLDDDTCDDLATDLYRGAAAVAHIAAAVSA